MIKLISVNGIRSNWALLLSELDNLIANSLRTDIIKYVEVTNPERVLTVHGSKFANSGF